MTATISRKRSIFDDSDSDDGLAEMSKLPKCDEGKCDEGKTERGETIGEKLKEGETKSRKEKGEKDDANNVTSEKASNAQNEKRKTKRKIDVEPDIKAKHRNVSNKSKNPVKKSTRQRSSTPEQITKPELGLNVTKPGEEMDVTPPRTPERESDGESERIALSPAQRARMEQRRQQALILKRDKMNRRNPYAMKTEKKDSSKVIRINDTKLIDTGGGFFIEENEGVSAEDMEAAMVMVSEPGPLFPDERPRCEECQKTFNSSFLLSNFDHPVCDNCRNTDDKHALITKTDARNEYLLKDVDLEKREPVLKFIVRKNPHNSRWGDMKLYLKLQVEQRALTLWGTEEALEEAIVKKDEQRETNKQKKFNKQMKELRMNVRSSLYTRATKSHQHEYGEETYLPDEDEYSRTCLTCGHSYTYDKL